MKRIVSVLLSFIIMISLPLCLAPYTQAATKLVAITFDDGPSGYTAGLLDGLKARGAKATFFLVGNRIGSYPNVMRRLVDEGHQIANHTTTHPQLTTLSASSVARELSACESKLIAYGGEQTYCLRPPYGSYNATTRQQSLGPLILWSVDTLDWKSRNADAVYNQIISKTTDGSIVLLHDLYPTSVQGALRAIDTLKAQGYECVTVNELFRRRGITMQTGAVYTAAYNKGITLPAVEAPKAPTIRIKNVWGGKKVTLKCATKDAKIYFTTDGSEPSEKSAGYSGAFNITKDMTIRAVAYNGALSEQCEKKVTLSQAGAPTATYKDGKLTLAANKSKIYFTTDGSAPTTKSAVYTKPIAMKTVCNVLVRQKGAIDREITYTVTKYGDLFTDISHKAWYYDAVGKAVHQGILVGTAEQTFAPQQKVSRAMFVTALYSLSGETQKGAATTFKDVNKKSWYGKAVAWAAVNGIVAGKSETTFAPHDSITREQMCVMLCRYLEHRDLSLKRTACEPFADRGEISAWAKKDVLAMQQMKLISGKGKHRVCPKDETTRSECAAMLVKVNG